MITLFDTTEKTLDGAAGYNADSFDYYNQSNRKDIGRVRELLEAWFSKYPDYDKADMKVRFQNDFQAAFFELYIYILFTKMGYALEIHPALEGTQKRPDYLAVKEDERFYIEVKQMTLLSQSEQAKERKQNTLLDALNTVDSSNFWLLLEEINFKSAQQPKGRNIVRFFDRELKKIDPDGYQQMMDHTDIEDIPVIIYDDTDVTIVTRLQPKSPEARGMQTGAVGTLPSNFMWGNHSENIQDALLSKASRYGKPGAPFIICLNKQTVGFDFHELDQALYGELGFSYLLDAPDKKEYPIRSGNGFFGNASHPKHTRVSGVYYTNVNTANLATTVDHAYRKNILASHPLKITLPTNIQKFLEIEDGYPGTTLPDLSIVMDAINRIIQGDNGKQ